MCSADGVLVPKMGHGQMRCCRCGHDSCAADWSDSCWPHWSCPLATETGCVCRVQVSKSSAAHISHSSFPPFCSFCRASRADDRQNFRTVSGCWCSGSGTCIWITKKINFWLNVDCMHGQVFACDQLTFSVISMGPNFCAGKHRWRIHRSYSGTSARSPYRPDRMPPANACATQNYFYRPENARWNWMNYGQF